MKPSAALTWHDSHTWSFDAVIWPHACAMFAVSQFVWLMQPDHCCRSCSVAVAGSVEIPEPLPEPEPEPLPEPMPAPRACTSASSHAVMAAMSDADSIVGVCGEIPDAGSARMPAVVVV